MYKVKYCPSHEEVRRFMTEESKPYRFEFVKEVQPLRISIERRVIYVNKEVLMKVIKDTVKAGLDWKEVMRTTLKHEKAHERFHKWILKWMVPVAEYGWIPSFLIDIIIDKIHFKDDVRYQRWLRAEARRAFETTQRDIWSLFPEVAMRPHFLYNQAAYWVAMGAITLEEATDLYPEKIDYIVEMSQLFKKIKSEEDLEWAFPKAKRIYLEMM